MKIIPIKLRNLGYLILLISLSSVCLAVQKSSRLGEHQSQQTRTSSNDLRVETPQFAIADRKSNLSDCRGLFLEAWVDHYRNTPPSDLSSSFHSVDDFRAHLNKIFDTEEKLVREGKGILVKALQNGTLLGWVIFQPDTRKKHSIYIKDLVVKPNVQRRGIGKHLIFSLKNVPGLFPGTKNISVVFRRFNFKAIAFYKKHGFKESVYSREDFDPLKFVSLELQNLHS